MCTWVFKIPVIGYSLYLLCYHGFLVKNKLTTFKNIQLTDKRFMMNLITEKEKYVLKRMPCCSTECGAFWTCYKPEKQMKLPTLTKEKHVKARIQQLKAF